MALFVVGGVTLIYFMESPKSAFVEGFVLVVEVVAVVFVVLLMAFVQGAARGASVGQRVERTATRARERCEIDLAKTSTALTEAISARERAEQSSREASREAFDTRNRANLKERRAREMLFAAESRMMNSDVAAIEATRNLPLHDRISAAFRVGLYASETHDDYQAHRENLIQRRVEQWQGRRLKGTAQMLLPLVERQHGLCGDPLKDEASRKGCGCYLFSLPSSAVHFDHIVPRNHGGTDDETNLQALCSFCNSSARDRYDSDPEEEEPEPLLVRVCMDCGEEEMTRELEPSYGTNGPYLWTCGVCGSQKSGGADFDAELYPP